MKALQPTWNCPTSGAAFTRDILPPDGKCLGCGATLTAPKWGGLLTGEELKGRLKERKASATEVSEKQKR